ncbi:alpha/beta hydrolase [Microbulbifer mangrovi]|uniref:alpha/beta hydrolase n=1 Tax=Microbulbifer mangrovi TaxID=927787 RepID=UPI0009906FA2|nr:alpha/beta hydrolase [Microbulbifer mangrovi]
MTQARPFQFLALLLFTGFLSALGAGNTTAADAPDTHFPESPSSEALPTPVEYRDVQWAQAGNKTLTTDIFVPNTGRKRYPVVVIFHGGGWLINDNRIMDATARYLARHGEFVVANMNYRLLGDNQNTTTMDDIVGDVLGGVLWVKEHISAYRGNPGQIAVTGDSAGGHLSAMVVLAANNLSGEAFSAENLAFRPTYIPAGKTPEQIADNGELQVQAAVFSYGAFDLYRAAQAGFESPGNIFWKLGNSEPRGIMGKAVTVDSAPELYKAVSPVYLIPDARDRKLPPIFAHVGSKDTTTPPSAVKTFVDKLVAAGQPVRFKEYPGKNHAFLDTGCNEFLGNCFDKDAPETLDDMIEFLQAHLE